MSGTSNNICHDVNTSSTPRFFCHTINCLPPLHLLRPAQSSNRTDALSVSAEDHWLNPHQVRGIVNLQYVDVMTTVLSSDSVCVIALSAPPSSSCSLSLSLCMLLQLTEGRLRSASRGGLQRFSAKAARQTQTQCRYSKHLIWILSLLEKIWLTYREINYGNSPVEVYNVSMVLCSKLTVFTVLYQQQKVFKLNWTLQRREKRKRKCMNCHFKL